MDLSSSDVIGENVCGIKPDVINITCRVSYIGNIVPNAICTFNDHEVVQDSLQLSTSRSRMTLSLITSADKFPSSSYIFMCNIIFSDNTSSLKVHENYATKWTSDTMSVITPGKQAY